MKKLIVLFWSVLFTSGMIAQDTTVTVYFKSGQSRLDVNQLAAIEKLKSKPYSRISLDGYADRSGKAASNQKLSYRRAAIAAKNFKSEAVSVKGKGVCTEKISADRMRKVVIRIWYEKPVAKMSQAAEIKLPPKPVSAECMEDTTLLIGGTRLTLNKCFYLKQKDCFKYNPYRTGEAARQAGLRTMNEKGEPIESGGMFDLDFCKDTCLKKPIIVYMPVPPCMLTQPMTLWTSVGRGNWKNTTNQLIIVKVEGVSYYKIEIYCSGRFNCDHPHPSRGITKVRLKNGMKFKSAQISNSCPITSFEGKISKNRKVGRFPYICPAEEPTISFRVKTKQGDTLTLVNQPLNSYSHRKKLRSDCPCSVSSKKDFLVLSHRKKQKLYRKYKIYRKNCQKPNERHLSRIAQLLRISCEHYLSWDSDEILYI